METKPDIKQFNSAAAAASAAALFILAKLKSALEIKKYASVALSGGSAPRQLNAALTEVLKDINIGGIDWFFGDERAVKPDDPRSNYRMQMETLLGPLNISQSRIHRIKGERGAVRGALDYKKNLIDFFPGPPDFDIIILGLGPDGHIASLFPKSPTLLIRDIPVTMTATAPLEPHIERITLTLPTINAAKNVIFFTGLKGKETVIEQLLHRFSSDSEVKDKPPSDQTYPFESVIPKSAPAAWFIYGSDI